MQSPMVSATPTGQRPRLIPGWSSMTPLSAPSISKSLKRSASVKTPARTREAAAATMDGASVALTVNRLICLFMSAKRRSLLRFWFLLRKPRALMTLSMMIRRTSITDWLTTRQVWRRLLPQLSTVRCLRTTRSSSLTMTSTRRSSSILSSRSFNRSLLARNQQQTLH